MLFSGSVMSHFLWPHGLQHARLPCLSPSPGVCWNSCPLSQWCLPTISSFVIPFSSLRSFPASESFLRRVSSSHQVAKVLELMSYGKTQMNFLTNSVTRSNNFFILPNWTLYPMESDNPFPPPSSPWKPPF